MRLNRSTKFTVPKNELFYYDGNSGIQKPLATNGGSIPITGIQQKILDAFETIDENLWDIKIGQGDVLTTGGTTAGSGYVKVSKSIFHEDTETVFTSKFIVKPAFRIGLGMSLSQRLMHQRFSMELVGVDGEGNEVNTMPVNPSIAISTLSQTTTTLTVTTSLPHGLVPADRIVLHGSSDSRFNYGEVIVATIISPTQFTVTASIFTTLPSLTASANGTGFVTRNEPLANADNALAVVWEGTSANNAKMISRTQKSTLFNSADTSMGTGNTNATIANAGAFADAFNPSFLYDMRMKTEGIIVRTFPSDSTGAYGGQIKRTQVVPDVAVGYKLRLRARNNVSATRVVAKVSNISKAGTTTATVTTVEPHGLTVTDQVQIYGVRDITSFPVLATTTIASVISPTQFTVVLGTAVTASSKGGVVIKVNGSYPIAPSAQSIQTITKTGGLVTVVGNTTWTGFSIGETVELAGLVDNTTGELYTAIEGTYQVANIATSTLTLYAKNAEDADYATKTIGGAVVKRTDFRLHLLRVLDYTRQTVEVDASVGNYADIQEALPVYAQGSVSISGVATISPSNTVYADTAISLIANGLYTGTARDMGASPLYGRMRVTLSHTAGFGHGHLYLQQSADSTTWFETHRIPVPSDGQIRTLEFPMNYRYSRIMFQNGATAQTQFHLSSIIVRLDGNFDLDKSLFFTASTTNLGASTAFTGVSHNLGMNHSITDHRAIVTASHDGTLYMEQSRDGVTWRTTKTLAVTANNTAILSDSIMMQYQRVRFLNGTTAQTSFELSNAFMRA